MLLADDAAGESREQIVDKAFIRLRNKTHSNGPSNENGMTKLKGSGSPFIGALDLHIAGGVELEIAIHLDGRIAFGINGQLGVGIQNDIAIVIYREFGL